MRFIVDVTDERMKYLCAVLVNAGHIVKSLDGSIDFDTEPTTVVASPARQPQWLMELLSNADMPQALYLIGGQSANCVKQLAIQKGITYFNITDDEVFAQKNAVVTAEGALMLILRHCNRAQREINVGITGYGRIAKELAALLYATGSKIYIFARSDVALANANKYNTYPIDALTEYADRLDVIVNTVPYRVIPNSCLALLRQNVLLIELASSPFGFDMEYAQKLNLNAMLASGLPAKTAPYSAAVYLYEVIIKRMGETLYA